MLIQKPYNREHAVAYAAKWAYGQNPLFGSFQGFGGNCTNFVSQCLYAGCCRMNYKAVFGWYYISMEDRTASWSGVNFFYNFIVGNEGVGPFGRECRPEETEIGDVIQLAKNESGYYHTLLIVGYDGEDPLVAAQTDNALNRPLSSYTYDYARYLKIGGVRLTGDLSSDFCFDDVLLGLSLSGGAQK